MAKLKAIPEKALYKREAIKPIVQKLLDAGDIQGVIDYLTPRQRRFVDEFLVDFDGANAVERAGYNVKNRNNACRLANEMLQHPGIKAVIDYVSVERGKSSNIKPEYVFKKIKSTIEKAEQADNHNAVLRGCELLARALGMFVERKEISGPNGDAIAVKQVKDAADAFTSSIYRLIERGGQEGSIREFILGDPS